MTDSRPVQVQMIQDTVIKVEKIKEKTRVRTKSDAVKAAIDIAGMVLDTIANKGKVFLINNKGEKTKITIPGVD